MARHQGQFPSGRSISGRLALLLFAAGAALGCRGLARDFGVSGTITLAARVQAKAPKNNAVLFIIAKNRGGVPIAVRRIVNPGFPVNFSMGPEDLLVPGTRPEGTMSLEVQMNTHGNVGKPVKGDLEGTSRDPVRAGERGVNIVIDREM